MTPNRTKFDSEMQVRPDDLDMNRHVHSSRYLDYVLAARYDQMARCYGMPMEEFIEHGFSWVMRGASILYKRPLGLGDWFVVRTWIHEIRENGVAVAFEIFRKEGMKLAASGSCDYVIVDGASGRMTTLPGWIIERYSV
ncbi:MAG TPA: acyl-CoA thioesterase [Candidatus Kapabacteria bacterium]|nr:acyl-CoA thioesterase [Candidatus Kapabacteria bacterium]